MSELFVFLTVAAVVVYWVDSLRAREAAMQACTIACRQLDVQLLEQTVRLARRRPGRSAGSGLFIQRCFYFEFSLDGVGRRSGGVSTLGARVTDLWLDMPEGRTWVTPHSRGGA